MSGLTGNLIGICLSLNVEDKEWHQRTGVAKYAEGLYKLHPGYPDPGTPTEIQFVARPYQSNNATVGVTPEALLYTVLHHLERPNADEDTRLAIAHIDQALKILHGRTHKQNKE